MNNYNLLYYLKKIGIIISLIILFFICLYLSIFYIPFIIAFLIAKLLEPLVNFLMKKLNFTRKTSTIIIITLVSILIICTCAFSIYKLLGETTNLLNNLNSYINKLSNSINTFYNKLLEIKNIKITPEIEAIFKSSLNNFTESISKVITNFLNKLLSTISSMPNIIINIIITILSIYFILSDKIYILDRMEHHLSKKIVGKMLINSREILSNLGSYLKAELILSFITFIIVLSGLNIFYLIGMEISFPILLAIIIGFVDALPILGAGSIMIPWSIILFLNSKYSIGFSILGLYIFILLVKQFLEPKIVSSKIGIHPIFTLISMYTSFKIIGILGLLVGPIILIIIKNIFSKYIEKGIVNSIIDI